MKKKPTRRTISLLLAVLFVLQTAVCAAAAPQAEEGTYTGKYMMAVNTDYSIARGGKQFKVEPVQADAEGAEMRVLEQLWTQVEPMSPQEALQADEAEDETVEAQGVLRPYRVGDVKLIPDISAVQTNIVSAAILKTLVTCVHVTDTCTIWKSLTCDWKEDKIRELADAVDKMIPQLEDLFGTPRIDTDRDGKLAIFIHKMPSGAAAYFNSFDIIDEKGRIGDVRMKTGGIDKMVGAACDCIHLGQSSKMENIRTCFVHEYQHYIHASYQYFGKTNDDYLNLEATYIDEGFSMAAQYILSITDAYLDDWTYAYSILDPRKHSLTDWVQATDAYIDSIVSYAMSFAFFQYVRTRYASLIGETGGEFPGKGIYKRVLQSRDRSNQDNTLGIIADILYPPDKYPALADTDARCRQLIVDFWLAVLYKNRDGEHGFNGEHFADALNLPRATISGTKTLRNGMAYLIKLTDSEQDTTVTVKGAEDGLRIVPIGMYAVTFDPNGGSGTPATAYTMYPDYAITDKVITEMYRKGYVLSGWAQTPDAQTPAYPPDATVHLTQDQTFYAVWKPAEQLHADTAYPTEGTALQAQFTPQENGVYFVDTDVPFTGVVFNPELKMRRSLTSPQDGARLRGGETYTIELRFDGDAQGHSFTIKKRTEYYRVDCYVDTDAYLDAQTGDFRPYRTLQYGTVYKAPNYTGEAKWGYTFAGWAETQGDKTVKYQAGETVTVTEDTSLYAVWKPWESIEEYEWIHKICENETFYYRFKPHLTGFFFIPAVGTISLRVYDADKNLLYNRFSDRITYTFRAGETYYITLSGKGAVGFCLGYLPPQPKHKVYLMVDTFSTLNVRKYCDDTFTIPDYQPVSYGYTEFKYWKDMETGKILRPGDTVNVKDRDVLLRAVCTGENMDEIADETNKDLSEITKRITSAIRTLILTMIKPLPEYIPIWFRCMAQRFRCFGPLGWKLLFYKFY